MNILRQAFPEKNTSFFGIAQLGKGEGGESEPQNDFDTFSVKQVAQTGCWGEGGVTCAMP